jgi:RimJ/RimL family protein N-acetyltransferase
MTGLATLRLILRPWRESDLAPFAEMNADPRVRKHLNGVIDQAASDAEAGRIQAHIEQHGWGYWAIEVPGVAPFIGFAGVNSARYPLPGLGEGWADIGWRLHHDHWGHGYATEAAFAALDEAFTTAGLSEVVSFTTPANKRSRRVMERLHMVHDPAGDFDHPNIPEGSADRRHVLYRITREAWEHRAD